MTRLLFRALLALTMFQGAKAAEIGAMRCKDWELASRMFYRGPGDKTFAFYEEANHWVIGHVLSSPRWPGSRVHEIVDGYFRGTTRDPNAVLTDVLTRITTDTLSYCQDHPLHSIAAAADEMLRTKQ